MRKFPTVLFVCAAWLLAAGAARAQQAPVLRRDDNSAPRQAQQATPVDDDDDDDESESADPSARTRPQVADPANVLRTARLVYVNSDTAFVNAREVEASLLKRKEFRAWGMAVTRNAGEADLIIEITRKTLTRRFTFTVVEPRTMSVVASGKTRSVLFGKKIPNKIAEKFTNRLRVYRPYPPNQ
jgi:hypothetical protein